jgi:hypothetical protein
MYEPTLGRFLARDPLPPNGQQILYPFPDMSSRRQISSAGVGFYPNAYAYAASNPTNFRAPRGVTYAPASEPSVSSTNLRTQPRAANKTIVRLCCDRITLTGRTAYHTSIVLECNNALYKFEAGPTLGLFTPKQCREKLKSCLYGQLYAFGRTTDIATVRKQNCITAVAVGDCEGILRCLRQWTKKINDCCIPYNPTLMLGGFNSNSAAWWLTARCIPWEDRQDADRKLRANCRTAIQIGWPPSSDPNKYFPDCLKLPGD